MMAFKFLDDGFRRLPGWLAPMRVRAFALLFAAAAAVALVAQGVQAATPWPGGRWEPGPARYGNTLVAHVSITMSDGVRLVGDVEYPSDVGTGRRAAGTFPVLLAQNPYFCDAPIAANARHDLFVQRGYIFATICVRGTGRSGGEFTFFSSEQEARDGVQLVNWAGHTLDGSNGIVGLTGCSYLGMNQLLTAARLPRNSPVKAMAPFCAGSETYREGWMGQGMPTETVNILPIFGNLVGPRGGAWAAEVYANILSGGPDAYAGHFWDIKTPGRFAAKIAETGIPALFWSGYQDMFNETSQDMYAYLQNAYAGRPVYGPMKPGQRVTGRYQIVVGPWAHGQGIDQNIELEWYDTWLKGQDTGIADTRTPMHMWELGANQWINTDTYPMVSNYTPYYLGAGAQLDKSKPKQRTAGGDWIMWAQPDSPGSVLTYTTDAFEAGATLAGPIGARLYASSTKELSANYFYKLSRTR